MKLLTLAFTYFKQTFSSRSVLIFTVLMPMVFTAVLGIAMEGMASGNTAPQWALLLADEDHSPQSAALRRQLEANPALKVTSATAAEIPAAVESGEAPVGLVISAGFGAALLHGQPADLRLYRSAKQLLDAQAVEAAVGTATGTLEGIHNSAALAQRVAAQLGAPAPSAETAFAQATALWEAHHPLEVRAEAVTRLKGSKVPIGMAQSAPGMLVMFVLFVTFGGGASLLLERERGTLRRLLVMPLRKSTLIGGKLAGIYLTALAQMGIMLLFGMALGVNWGQDPLALLVMLLTYAFAATALGILVASVVRTAAQADGLNTVTIMVVSALGGAWWPLEIVPPWMKTLAKALPTTWGMQGFQDIISRGLGLCAVLPEAGVLLAFGAASLLVGLWRFRWE